VYDKSITADICFKVGLKFLWDTSVF
jgi:hypothetical protein